MVVLVDVPLACREQEFDIASMIPLPGGGVHLLAVARQLAANVAYFLPRNCSRAQVRERSTGNGLGSFCCVGGGDV